jgi:hypothetical protein
MPAVPPRGPATDVVFNLGDGCCWTRQQCLPGSPPSTSSSNSVVDASRPTDSTPRGPTIDVIFKIGGGCYQTCRQSLPVGPPLTSSSNLVVDAAGSARQRSCHRRHLQTQWWTMSDMLAAPPRGGHHRHPLQTHWWTLPDPPATPPRGPPLMSSSTLMVDTVAPAGIAPRGPAIDIIFKTR